MAMTFLPASTPTLPITPTILRCRGGRFGADNEVGSAQHEEMQRVVLEHERVIDQLANLPARRGRLDLVEGVQRLGRGHVMGGGADAADPAGDLRHVLGGPADAEDLEAAQFGHLQIGALDVAFVIEEDVDLAVAFEPGDGIDGERGAGRPGKRRWRGGCPG